MNEITIGIELTTTMIEDEAHGIPFEKWDGSLPLCTMLDTCNNCLRKGMFTNSIGGANVNKLTFETSLEEQTTSKGLQEKTNFQYLKFSGTLSVSIVQNAHKP
jgi:hypothetical protein